MLSLEEEIEGEEKEKAATPSKKDDDESMTATITKRDDVRTVMVLR